MKQEFRFKKSDALSLMARLSAFLQSLDSDKEYVLTIDRARGRRSLDANAYFWVLLGKMAALPGLPTGTSGPPSFFYHLSGSQRKQDTVIGGLGVCVSRIPPVEQNRILIA